MSVKRRIITAIKRFILNTVREDMLAGGSLSHTIRLKVQPSNDHIVRVIRNDIDNNGPLRDIIRNGTR